MVNEVQNRAVRPRGAADNRARPGVGPMMPALEDPHAPAIGVGASAR